MLKKVSYLIMPTLGKSSIVTCMALDMRGFILGMDRTIASWRDVMSTIRGFGIRGLARPFTLEQTEEAGVDMTHTFGTLPLETALLGQTLQQRLLISKRGHKILSLNSTRWMRLVFQSKTLPIPSLTLRRQERLFGTILSFGTELRSYIRALQSSTVGLNIQLTSMSFMTITSTLMESATSHLSPATLARGISTHLTMSANQALLQMTTTQVL
mmetsp:Transcript_20949/g.36058  ORF Transcript_20949/g.36058 Transcript_20949/m.36058 type:complete len:213 (-) Transcript_20949:1719-2357(-)